MKKVKGGAEKLLDWLIKEERRRKEAARRIVKDALMFGLGAGWATVQFEEVERQMPPVAYDKPKWLIRGTRWYLRGLWTAYRDTLGEDQKLLFLGCKLERDDQHPQRDLDARMDLIRRTTELMRRGVRDATPSHELHEEVLSLIGKGRRLWIRLAVQAYYDGCLDGAVQQLVRHLYLINGQFYRQTHDKELDFPCWDELPTEQWANLGDKGGQYWVSKHLKGPKPFYIGAGAPGEPR